MVMSIATAGMAVGRMADMDREAVLEPVFGIDQLEALRLWLVQRGALLEADQPRGMDACERLDLWQHLYAVRTRLPLVEWALTATDEPEPDQPAVKPSADDISARRRPSARRARSRSVARSAEEVTGLRTSR